VVSREYDLKTLMQIFFPSNFALCTFAELPAATGSPLFKSTPLGIR
jgi:hypothetical protein